MDARESLRQAFNDDFAAWEIVLPPDAMQPGVVWLIVQRGWTIWTLLGEADGRECLDYYAMHRMTNDRHLRLFADGKPQGLPTISGMVVFPAGATAEECARIKAEHYQRNQEVEKMLEGKGFVMTDHAHPSAILNRYLQTNPDVKDAF